MKALFNFSSFALFFAFSILIIANTYSNPKRDSLDNLLVDTNDEFTRVKLLIELSKTYFDNDYEKAINLANEALNIAKWNNYNNEVIDSYNIIGSSYFFSNNYSKALENYFYATKHLEKISDSYRLAKVYRNIALIYKFLQSPEECIKFSNLSLGTLQKRNGDDLTIDCYFYLASSYRLLGKHQTEIQYLIQAIELRKKNNQWDKLGNEYNSLGIAYWSLQDYKKALKYFNLNLKLSTKYSDSLNVAWANSNIGSTYYSTGGYAKAVEFFNKAVSLRQSNISHSYLGLVNSYSKLNNTSNAIHFFNLAQKEHSDLNKLAESCKLLVECFRRLNKPDQAFFYNDIYYSISDSLRSISKKEVQLTSKLKYEVEGIEEQIIQKESNMLLKENLELRSEQNRFLLIILILIFIIGAGAVYLVRRRLMQKEKRLVFVEEGVAEIGKCLEDIKAIRSEKRALL